MDQKYNKYQVLGEDSEVSAGYMRKSRKSETGSNKTVLQTHFVAIQNALIWGFPSCAILC